MSTADDNTFFDCGNLEETEALCARIFSAEPAPKPAEPAVPAEPFSHRSSTGRPFWPTRWRTIPQTPEEREAYRAKQEALRIKREAEEARKAEESRRAHAAKYAPITAKRLATIRKQKSAPVARRSPRSLRSPGSLRSR
eukprot:tig00000459_g1140.t1